MMRVVRALDYSQGMKPRILAAAACLAAALSLTALAQTTAGGDPQQNAQPTQSAAPASQTQPTTPAPQNAPLQLHDLPPDPHTPTPAETEQSRQQQILSAATQMAMAQARWGPQISTPGLSITLT